MTHTAVRERNLPRVALATIARNGALAALGACATLTGAAAQKTYYACTAARMYQDTVDLEHRGWGLDARGKWSTASGALPDVLTGSFRPLDLGTTPMGSSSIALYINPALGSAPDCMLPSWTVQGIGVDRFGWSLSWIGDLDSDGRDDFVVGAPLGGPGVERGRAYLFLSSDFPAGDLPAKASGASLIIEGVDDGSRFGYSVAGAGHFIPEVVMPLPDVAIGAPGGYDSAALAQPGALYVFSGFDLMRVRLAFGMSAVIQANDPLFSSSFETTGHKDWDRYGHAVALAGDVNLDGASDIVVGAPQWHFSGGEQTTGSGYARVYLGGITHTVYQMRGEQDGSWFGNSVGGELNINGFGHEVLVGAPRYDDLATNPSFIDVGKAYIWSRRQPDVFVRTHTGTATHVQPVGWIGEESGWGLVSIGDLDGDSFDEYTVGSWAYTTRELPAVCSPSPAPCSGQDAMVGGDRAGRSRVFHGASGRELFQIVGEDRKDSAGLWASPIGDVDGNGKPDLLISAFRWSPLPVDPAQREIGRIYLHLTE